VCIDVRILRMGAFALEGPYPIGTDSCFEATGEQLFVERFMNRSGTYLLLNEQTGYGLKIRPPMSIAAKCLFDRYYSSNYS